MFIFVYIFVYMYIYFIYIYTNIWNRKTLAQNEYHIYRQIPLHTHDILTN